MIFLCFQKLNCILVVCKANCQKFISEALPDNNHTTSVNDGWNHFTPHLNLKENFPGEPNSYSASRSCLMTHETMSQNLGDAENKKINHFSQVSKRVNLKRKNAKRPNLMSLKKLENLVMSF